MIGDELARLDQLEPAIGQPLGDLLGREAQALVRKLLAQELELVGSEIDDEQASPRRQHARRLAHGALRVAQEVQHLVHHRGADRLVGKRQIVDVALPHVRAPGSAAFELRARVGQHGRAQVDAEAAPIALAEELEHAPRSGAEVEEEIERARAQRLRDDGLHVRLGHVQGADAVPFAGVGLEVGLSRLLALLPQGLCAPPVADKDRIGAVHGLEDQPRERPALASLGQPEIHPAAFRRALHQPGLGQQLQMPADAGLALPQDAREVLDVELSRREQHDQAQPRRLGHGLQGNNRTLYGQLHPRLLCKEA